MLKITGLSAAAALLGLSLGVAGPSRAQTMPPPAAAPGIDQPPAPAQQNMPGMTHGMPMQGGGMCGPGGACGMATPGQGTPMQGRMQHGQGDAMQGGCPMMRRSAALEQRLRQLEERLGILAPASTQPGAPG